jgi:BCD family chlorophyll transporter-like MFS transporter
MSFNFATVSHFIHRSREGQRARTVGVMWFMLIVGVIVAAIAIGRSLAYTPAALFRVHRPGRQLLLGFGGLLGLERAAARRPSASGSRQAGQLARTPGGCSSSTWWYCQALRPDLAGPYAADVFGVPVRRDRVYRDLGAALLVALLLTSPLARRVGNRAAAIGRLIASGLR